MLTDTQKHILTNRLCWRIVRICSAITHRDYRDDIQFIGLCLILGLTSWAGLCQLRAETTLKLREQPFVTASKCWDKTNIQIILRPHNA